MAHWRDGGIGNMPGSDDRPIEEWTLLEKLAALTSLNAGDPAPAILCGVDNWPGIVAKIAQAGFDEIQRLRGGYPADLADPVVVLRERAAGYESLLKEPQWSPMRSHIEPDIGMLRGAADAIERLREGSANRDAIITECLNALESEFAAHEKSNEAQGLLHAMEVLEALKTAQEFD